MALGTFWLKEKILHSTVMLAGRDSAAESGVLNMFYNSISEIPVVKEICPGGAPFADFLVREERPALFSVLWPIISLDDYAQFGSPDVFLAAAFFTALGIERNA
jgi:hypothetical protein